VCVCVCVCVYPKTLIYIYLPPLKRMHTHIHREREGEREIVSSYVCSSDYNINDIMIILDSSSESDDGLEEFYSTNDYRLRQRQKQVCDKSGKSKLCLNINITRGRITALMDCKVSVCACARVRVCLWIIIIIK